MQRACSRERWNGLDSPDQGRLLHTMAETHIKVHVLPVATAQPAAVDTRVYRPYESGRVLLAADGAMEVTPDGDTLGWGALVADTVGVLATVASGVLTRAASTRALSGRASWKRGSSPRRQELPPRWSTAMTGASSPIPPGWTALETDVESNMLDLQF